MSISDRQRKGIGINMLKLMKYEFRKQMFSKIIMLVLAMILEVFFINRVLTNNASGSAAGVIGLAMLAMLSLGVVAIECIVTYNRDMKTKQGYMLFMMPVSTFEILGAKLLATFAQLAAVGIFFAALGAIDVMFLVTHTKGFEEALEYMKQIISEFGIYITTENVLLWFGHMLFMYFVMIMISFVVITLINAVFSNLRGKIIIASVIEFGVYWLFFKVIAVTYDKVLANNAAVGNIAGNLIFMAVELIFGCAAYAASAWMLNKKINI